MTLMSSSATRLLDYNTLSDKLTVLSTEVVPAAYSRYFMYLLGDDLTTAAAFLRMESCDTLAGYAAGFLCSPTNSSCRVPRAPSATDYDMSMSTAPDAAGGDGRSRLYVSGVTANPLYVGVTIPTANPNYTAATVARFGVSTYELHVATGRALYVKQPTLDGVGALRVSVNAAENTVANLQWTPPLALTDATAVGYNYTTFATGVTYHIYVARDSFAAAVAAVTNTSVGAAGVMPNTACGLERWARLMGANVTHYTTQATNFKLTGLTVAQPYEVNIVAECNDVCLRATAAANGFAVQDAALSTQRVPYASTSFKTSPPREIGPVIVDDAPNKVTGVLAPMGVVITVLLIAFVGYIVYRNNQAEKARAAATARAVAGSPPAAGAVSVPMFAG
ncbi:hypothetical protein EON68_03600, partial [archaeon]